MKRRKARLIPNKAFNHSSDDSNDDCAILYSIPRTSVYRTGDRTNPLVRNVASIVVKMEPKSPGAPHSPLLWADVIEFEEAFKNHEGFLSRRNVYTPKMLSGVVPRIHVPYVCSISINGLLMYSC